MKIRALIICLMLVLALIGCESEPKPSPDEQASETTPAQTVLLDEKLTVTEAKALVVAGTYKYSYTNYRIELSEENFSFGGNEYFVFQATIPIDGSETEFKKIEPEVAVDKITGEIFAVHAEKLVPIAEDSFWGTDRDSTIEVAERFSWNGQFVRQDSLSVVNLIADEGNQTFHFSLRLANPYGECSLKSLVGEISNSSSTNKIDTAYFKDEHSDFTIKFIFLDDETLQLVTDGTNPYGRFSNDEIPLLDGLYTLNEFTAPVL